MKNILIILIIFAALWIPKEGLAQVILKTDTVTLACDDETTFAMPIRVENFDGVGSFQFTLSWNPAHLDYQYTGAVNPLFLIGSVNIGFDTVTFVNQGKLTFTWTKFGGGSVPDDSIVFPVYFKRIGGPTTPVEFVSTPVAVEITDASGNEIPWSTIPGQVIPIDNVPPSITCPNDVSVQSSIPLAVNGIGLQSSSDNCALDQIGWSSTGASTYNFPNDNDASGAVFNFGTSTVTYSASDVGGNTATCSFTVNVENTGTGELTFIASNPTVSCGGQAVIDITVLNFDSLGSAQFSMAWDAQVLDFDSVGSLNPTLQINATNFGIAQTGNGLLSFNWTTGSPFVGTTLPDGAVMFRVYLSAIGNPGGSTAFSFGDMPAVREVVDPFGIDVPATWVNGQITFQDTQAPDITCPVSVSVDAPNNGTQAPVSGLSATATDDCGSATITWVSTGATSGSGANPADGTYNVGVTNIVFTATDGAGNTSTCQMAVTVNGTEPLSLLIDSIEVDCQGNGQKVCADITVQQFNSIIGLQFQVEWDETVLDFDGIENIYPGINLTASSFLGYLTTPNGVLQFLDGNSSTGWPQIPNGGTFFSICFNVLDANATTAIEFKPPFDAVDGSFNSVALVPVNGSFKSVDLGAPVFTSCPTDITVNADSASCTTVVTLPAPDVIDSCGTIASLVSDKLDSLFSAGTTLVTFTAADNSGNTATCAVNVTVLGNTNPVLSNCPSNIAVFVSDTSCTATANWSLPQAANACGQPIDSITSNFTSGSSFPGGNTIVVFTATDGSGNTATCSFTVTVQDTILPVLNCPQPLNLAPDSTCTAKIAPPAVDATDNCPGTLQVTNNFPADSVFAIGTTVLTYNAIDAAGNFATCSFNVNVFDQTPPDILCPLDTVVASLPDTCGAFVDWDDPVISDDCSVDLSITGTNDPGSFFTAGTVTVVYTAIDESGNVSACSFDVTVTENVPPTLTGCPTDFIIVLPDNKCDTLLTWAEPGIADNCGIDSIAASHEPPFTFGTGQTQVTYEVFDFSGNTAFCSFIVNVYDQVPPVFATCPDDITIDDASPCGVTVNWQVPAVTDNCDPAPDTLSIPQPGTTFFAGNTQVVMYAVDNSGNADTCAFTVIVNVNGIPGFDNTPDDQVFYGCEALATWNTPTPVGFCDNLPPTSNFPSGTVFGVGEHVVVFTKFDANGIPVTTSFTISVLDTIAPAFSVCPSDTILVNTAGIVVYDPTDFINSSTVLQGCDGATLLFSLPPADDNCDSLLVEQISGFNSGSDFTVGTYNLVFKASDGGGNAVECPVTLEVIPLAPLEPLVDPNPGCFGDMVLLTVDTIPNTVYTWTGPLQQYPSTHQITILQLTTSTEGVYTVKATINGCDTPVDSVEVFLATEVEANEDLDFVVDPNTTLDSFNVLLNDVFLAGDGEIVRFDTIEGLTYLGDGFFSFDAAETSVTFRYKLCSKACPDLCEETLVTITVGQIDQPCANIPNIISPNGDGTNDFLRIKCLDDPREYPDNELIIYNQWGDKVFEKKGYDNSPANAWFGTLNGEAGKDLPDGVYFYIFRPGPTEATLKGFVQIFR